MPKFLIHIKRGREKGRNRAQYVLNKLYEIFKDEKADQKQFIKYAQQIGDTFIYYMQGTIEERVIIKQTQQANLVVGEGFFKEVAIECFREWFDELTNNILYNSCLLYTSRCV